MNCNGDKKGNITAAFGSDIILEGVTGVPNLLLKYYSKIGITDSEMMLIIQLMHLQTAADKHFPSLDFIMQYMSGDKDRVKAELAGLIEKGIIRINHMYCAHSDEVVPVYNYEPLFEKISELWACEKVKNYQQLRQSLRDQKQGLSEDRRPVRQPAYAKVCQAFEKEFGRLLSPMEIEQVNLWLDDNNGRPEMILEALKRAVLLGKHNFKYIDSILLEWQKNNLHSISEILDYEANFRERQVSRPARRKAEPPVNKKDKFKLLYLG